MHVFDLQDILPPHHPGSSNTIQSSGFSAVASFPDGPSSNPVMNQQPPVMSQQRVPGASGALSDLLGLESELTSIQVKPFW